MFEREDETWNEVPVLAQAGLVICMRRFCVRSIFNFNVYMQVNPSRKRNIYITNEYFCFRFLYTYPVYK